MKIRPIERRDRQQWDPLWQGYLDFYEATLSQDRTDLTWERFFDSTHVFKAFVAEIDDVIVGIAHAMLRQSTWESVGDMYLEDLFVAPTVRTQGVGRALIEHVKKEAVAVGASSLYWQTREGNATARRLYDSMTPRNDFIQYSIKL